MELQFDKLITYSIKRLTRPKFKHDFAQFNDPAAFKNFDIDETFFSEKNFNIDDYDPLVKQTEEQRSQQMVQLGCNRNDISYDGLPSDCSLNYISAFGKIYVQERFRVLFTLMNTSEKH